MVLVFAFIPETHSINDDLIFRNSYMYTCIYNISPHSFVWYAFAIDIHMIVVNVYVCALHSVPRRPAESVVLLG